MERFLLHQDELGKLIQSGAAELYKRLNQVDADSLGMPDHCLWYYKESHTKRLFFSIETSASLLYGAIKMCGKPVNNLVLMDYGAGVGTLFLLAKLIGCEKVIYNDHLEEWKHSAELIAKAAGITIDHYIVGDIDVCVDALDKMALKCDIITSRNVIEHIYQLNAFYDTLHKRQSRALIYSSTTANSSNPAAVFKHKMWHKKWEKVYHGKRLNTIRRQIPGITDARASALARATQGLALHDLNQAIEAFQKNDLLPDPSKHRSNTCDPDNGVWAEHLLNETEYRQLINDQHYDIFFKPGFWDTHYKNYWKNIAGKLLNRFNKNEYIALTVAPFIYVIAKPKSTA